MRLLHKLSPHDVATTIDRLAEAVELAGATVFARVDHADAADHVGLNLRPTQVLIFGNPKVGTRLMQANQTIGIELPMRVLAGEDADGQVHVHYPDVAVLASGFDIPSDGPVAAISDLLEKVTGRAVAKE